MLHAKNAGAQAATVSGPLHGLRVLDLTRILAGPSCTQLLGDYGADVIKVERPGAGDDTRSWGPPYVTGKDNEPTAESAYYLSANRNKRSVALDLKDPRHQDIIRQMALRSDVFIENFKVGQLAGLGLDYETLSSLNPRLVYCSITGFGQDGPNASKPGYDLLAQAYGGLMSITGEPLGQPMKVAVGLADIICGLYAASAILAALRHRDETGLGQHIDLGLVDTQVASLVNAGTNYLTSGRQPGRLGNQHPNIVPYQAFAVADGHVVVAVGNDAQFARFCEVVGRPELAGDPRYATNSARLENRDVLIDIISGLLRGFRKSELIAGLEGRGVPGCAINDIAEVFGTDQVQARNMAITMPYATASSGKVDLIGNPVKFSRTPVTYRYAPPTCGEHTDQILNGLSAESPQRA
jgi:crotonobetainyl-CoA:carnitine CoA-transferase CaiB-like acyl-CoA transferase